MILLWGLSGDQALSKVRRELEARGATPVLLDQRDVLEMEIELSVGAGVEGRVRLRTERIDLGQVRSAYLRVYDIRRIPHIARLAPHTTAVRHAFAVEEALATWSEITSARIVSKFSAMATNSSKPYQARLLEQQGFLVPTTLLTTDPAEARDFSKNRQTIYKSVSGVRSIVARVTQEHEDRFDDVRWCPTQFQQFVDGDDYRVHVVGETLFACRIRSKADDYRYAARQSLEVQVEACDLDPAVAERCLRVAQALNLPVAGLDLRRTPGGEWYCFEVNPSPGFPFYEDSTGQPIARAIADLLLS